MSTLPEFGGSTFDPKLDGSRLRAQLAKVRSFMFRHSWVTLAQIAEHVGAPEASCSARLRDLRKPEYGSYEVQRRRVENGNGLHEYKLLIGPVPALAHGKTPSENAGAP